MRRIVLAAAVAASLVSAAPAVASRTQLSVFEDDRLLVGSGDAAREQALDEMAALGVDVVHTVVGWGRVAPPGRKRPKGFDGADPASYPQERWAPYDALVAGAQARGMRVMLAPAAPIPEWASGCRGSAKVKRTCRPNPTHFRRFVEALARRYPSVTMWAVWNEPNQGSWLSPQYELRGGRKVAVSPDLYRGLVRGALKGLKAAGHGRDEVLFGETAPLGRTTGALRIRPMPPKDFLEGVLCLRPAAGCDAPFPRLAVTAVGHHPYARGGSRSPAARGSAKEITIASVSRLKSILGRAAKRGRVKRNLPIWYTEYGLQTNPPDTIFGVPLDRQAAWINQADWMAWRDPRVKAVAQYGLRDDSHSDGFQTGLRFADGRAKPALAAYKLPIWVSRRGSGVTVWGQVRPATGTTDVEVQADDGAGFTTVQTVTTTSAGFLSAKLPTRARQYRLRWAGPGGAVLSRVAEVGR
ncbi:MAG: cellulase family glycosylhydrolase [Solirubrobacterales bacterium]|nr:cellulase family glycosylhydrolase [Solirubrobacterales bacterium]